MTLYLVCEDQLSETVMRKIVQHSLPDYENNCMAIGRKGKGYIKNKINDFNNKCNTFPFFILVDLDTDACAPTLRLQWMQRPCRENLIFRIAVREIEAWLLADTEGFSRYLNVRHEYIKKEIDFPDLLLNPKEKLLSLVERSKKKELIRDIVMKENTCLRQGSGYNIRLTDYVLNFWNIERAMAKSDSLHRTIHAVENFHTSQK